jgi:hypothetical protein
MRIRLAVIPPDDLTGVIRLTGDLRSAVNAGDMDGVDAATEKLMAVTAKMRSVDITEEEWRRFLTEVRAENAAFQSDYVVPGQLCSQFFPDATADTMVLQLPFTPREADDV